MNLVINILRCRHCRRHYHCSLLRLRPSSCISTSTGINARTNIFSRSITTSKTFQDNRPTKKRTLRTQRNTASHLYRSAFTPLSSNSNTNSTLTHNATTTTFTTNPLLQCDPITTEILSPSCTQDDIANALRPHHTNQTPVLLRNSSLSASDAIYFWKSMDYLRLAVGVDTPCHVEIGGPYNQPNGDGSGISSGNVERPEISFGDYLDYLVSFEERYGSTSETVESVDQHEHRHPQQKQEEEELQQRRQLQPKMEEIVYLAQNDLFQPLYNDFTIPSLCRDGSFHVGNGRLYSTMIWFGPRGCVSPLHYDPLDNLLMQFVGRKRVLLFPKSSSSSSSSIRADSDRSVKDNDNDECNEWHYSGYKGLQQYNTSPVDPERIDLDAFPNFANAPRAIECYLYPGDVLFIPSKWWHHVRSLDTVLSVNAWWR